MRESRVSVKEWSKRKTPLNKELGKQVNKSTIEKKERKRNTSSTMQTAQKGTYQLRIFHPPVTRSWHHLVFKVLLHLILTTLLITVIIYWTLTFRVQTGRFVELYIYNGSTLQHLNTSVWSNGPNAHMCTTCMAVLRHVSENSQNIQWQNRYVLNCVLISRNMSSTFELVLEMGTEWLPWWQHHGFSEGRLA